MKWWGLLRCRKEKIIYADTMRGMELLQEVTGQCASSLNVRLRSRSFSCHDPAALVFNAAQRRGTAHRWRTFCLGCSGVLHGGRMSNLGFLSSMADVG